MTALRYLIVITALLCAGCASYVTPDGAAPLDQLNRADVTAGSTRQPAPQLPAGFAVVRAQASPYKSASSTGFGVGRFSVIVAGDVVTADQLKLIAKWPSVETAAPLNGAWLPQKLDSLDDLRGAAAKMQADILMVYTVGTAFQLDGKAVPAEGSIPLGAKPPTSPAAVTAAASAVFVDVRTGYVYGHASATATADIAGLMQASDVLDRKRLEVEQDALNQLLASAGKTWADIAKQYE